MPAEPVHELLPRECHHFMFSSIPVILVVKHNGRIGNSLDSGIADGCPV